MRRVTRAEPMPALWLRWPWLDQAGPLPEAPCHRRPLGADVAADQVPVREQPPGDADRRIPGERPPLDGLAGTEEAHQQPEQGPLVGAHRKVELRRPLTVSATSSARRGPAAGGAPPGSG